MGVVLYYGLDEKGNEKAEGLVGEDLSAYIETEETAGLKGSLAGLVEVLVAEGYAEKEEDKGEFYVTSNVNGNYAGFILVYDTATKELLEITIDKNGEQNEAISAEDFDTFLDNEEYMFPICTLLGVGEEA